MIGVTVTAEVDGETISGHFDFARKPDEDDLAACREVLVAMHRKFGG